MSIYLFENKKFYNNFIKIINEDDKYYWYIDTFIEKEHMIGPYQNKDDLLKEATLQLNFKNILLNKLFVEFKNKDMYLFNKDKNDEDNFKSKRRLIGLVEFTVNLVLNTDINNNIIIIILDELLTNNKIPTEYLEGIYVIWNYIYNNCTECPFEISIMKEFNIKATNLLNYSWESRELFLIDTIIESINNTIYKDKNNINSIKEESEDIETKIDK